MMRLFVALAVPEDVARDLAALANGMPGARWSEPENMHVTLRFIGEVDDHTAEEIDHELTRVTARPFGYEISGLDTFGQGFKAHSLFAAVKLTPELDLLQGRVDAAVVRARRPREARKFRPHVTLARLNKVSPDRLQDFIAAHNLVRAGPIAVDHFILYESRPGNGGPVYVPLQEYPL